MAQPLLVGDLVRPTAEFVRQGSVPCSGRHIYGSNFAARRPALVVALLETSGSCYVAFRLKNGKWKQPALTQFRGDAFELIHRPAASHLLNPFDVGHPVPVNQDVAVHLAKKYCAVLPIISGISLIDPDVPVFSSGRPVVPAVLGRAMREALERVVSNGPRCRDQPSGDAIQARGSAAYDAARNDIRARYKVSLEHLAQGGSMLWVRQLHDCYRLMPTTRCGGGHGAQCREAWRYIGHECTDRELGELTLEILNQPNVGTEHVAKTDPFVGRVLSYIDLPAMEADMQRHWPA